MKKDYLGLGSLTVIALASIFGLGGTAGAILAGLCALFAVLLGLPSVAAVKKR